MINRITYAHTVLKVTDGNGEVRTLQAGDVVRYADNARCFAFSDAIILGFSDPAQNNGSVYVKLGRPFAYASCIGTTSPSVLTGVEEFSITLADILSRTTVSERPLTTGSKSPVERGYESEIIHAAI